MLKKSILCFIIIAFNSSRSLAAPSFRVDKVYPELGLKMRVLGNSVPKMLPQFKTFTYTYTRGTESFKRDKFSARELWYADQHCGQWVDDNGNTLTIGKATNQLPLFKETHVLREEFEAALADPENKVNPHNQGSINKWIESFIGRHPEAPVKLRTSSNFKLRNAMFIPIKGESPLTYLFQVKIHTPAGRLVASDWYCAIIKIKDSTEPKKARSIFESQFLAKVAAAPRTYTTTKANHNSKELKPSRNPGNNAKIQDSPSREAARKSIAGMKDWWFAETQEYIFLSDIRSSTGRTLVREIKANMPYLRKAFAKLIPPFEPLTDANVVRIFEDSAAYKQYVGPKHEWSCGLWSPMQRELVILSQGRNRDKTLEIIKHEGFHQYLFFSCDMTPNLPWYNEGHACFFETADIDRRGVVKIKENSRVQHLLRNLDAASKHIPTLLAMDHSTFYQSSSGMRDLNYTTAWSLIYYLYKGAPLERKNPYGKILDTYLVKLKSTKNSSLATTEAFRGIDIKEFQDDFKNFWKRQRSKGQRYDPLAKRR